MKWQSFSNQYVANINARDSSATTKKISSDDMSGLEPVIFLATLEEKFRISARPCNILYLSACRVSYYASATDLLIHTDFKINFNFRV